jgi:formate-dependent nitrite reductase membrane component NrfD
MNEIDINRLDLRTASGLEIWGWEVAGYLFLGGIAAGIMVLSVLAVHGAGAGAPSRWLRRLPFAAPVLVSVGMLLLFLDLEAKEHVHRFYLALRLTSPMSWGAWILVLIYPATVLLGIARMTDGETARLGAWRPARLARIGAVVSRARRWARGRIGALERANAVLGVALGLYTGLLLGTLEARPLWNTSLLAPLFLVSGLSTGAAVMMLFPLHGDEHDRLRGLDLLAIGGEVVVLALFLIDRATSGAAASEAAARFLGGDLTAAFWSLVVVAGLVVPALLEVIEARRHSGRALAAPFLVLIGGFALRWIIVSGGQQGPLA